MALRRPFEGKGRQLVWADPDRSWLGFFYACCFPLPCRTALLPSVRGKRGRGKASRGSSRSVASLSPLYPSSKQCAMHGAASRLCPRVVGSAHAAGVASGHDHRHTLDHGSASASRKGHPSVSRCRSERGALSGVETATQRRQAREPLEPPHERCEPRVLGLLDSVQAHQYTREQSHGSPPSWVSGPRDLSGGGPVRLSVGHMGP